MYILGKEGVCMSYCFWDNSAKISQKRSIVAMRFPFPRAKKKRHVRTNIFIDNDIFIVFDI